MRIQARRAEDSISSSSHLEQTVPRSLVLDSAQCANMLFVICIAILVRVRVRVV